jgi:hypothetical protein
MSLWEEGAGKGGVGQYQMALPEVWGEQRLYRVDREEGGREGGGEGGKASPAPTAEPGSSNWQAPLVMSFVKNATEEEEEDGGKERRDREERRERAILPHPSSNSHLSSLPPLLATLLVLIRGTAYSYEWDMDFQYEYAAAEEVARFFPFEGEEEGGREGGRVHGGFFKAFSRLARPLVEEEVGRLVEQQQQNGGQKRRKLPEEEEEGGEEEDEEEGGREGGHLRRVIVSGHSLGGSVGALVALFIAEQFPELQVDLVTFGAPNVGDAAFGRRFDRAVNNRHVRRKGGREGGRDGGRTTVS